MDKSVCTVSEYLEPVEIKLHKELGVKRSLAERAIEAGEEALYEFDPYCDGNRKCVIEVYLAMNKILNSAPS